MVSKLIHNYPRFDINYYSIYETEDEHIVINRKSEKKRIRLVDDEDLVCIIWS
uniref:Uncharacterized protein n=1 Tax=Rhizophagus irregularis (strain DAOM 181602 / DAOM 197198 / MUCL 43194) TaxID=747089 RepID=U9T7Y0_RHIID